MSARRILFAVLATTLALAPSAFADSADIVDADVELRLASDASLLVTEHLTFDYDGSFQGSYRDIDLLHGERIKDVTFSQGETVYEPGGNTALGSNDRPGVFGTERFGNTYRVVWHYRASDEQRTYDLSYRVVGAAEAYDDVIDVGWAVWGSQWDFDLDRLSASLTNPALDPADPAYRVWGHPRSVDGETERGDGIATLEAEDVDSGTAVEFRVTVPRTPGQNISGARQVSGDGLPGILAEEQELDDDYNSFVNRLVRFVENNWLALILGLAALVALLHVPLGLLAREHADSIPEYLPEPPDDAPPALAYGLAHEGVDSDDTVLATLLDLIDRGYYATSSATSDDEKLDLAIKAKPAAERPQNPLASYEQEVLEFFDQLLDGEQVALSDMKDKIPEHSDLWRGRWERMTEEIYSADEGHIAWDRNFNPLRYALIVIAVLLQGLITLVHAADGGSLVFPLGLAVLTFVSLGALPAVWFKRVSRANADRVASWKAFAHWTEDFPRLKDDPPQTLDLWKRIIVYGVAFGTADRMIKSGRIPEPVTEMSRTSDTWGGYVFTGSFNSSSFDGSSFSSGFASQVAPQSSSSGGGGGFSGGGGGGGFSGGGGGGSW